MAMKKTLVLRKQDDERAILENVAATMSTAQEQITRLLGGARGTGDVTDAARAVVAQHANDNARPAPEPTVAQKIEAALRTQSLDIADLARATKVPVGKISEAMKPLRKVGQVANVGTEDHPIWAWKIGDAPTPELVAWVRRMIMERPMTTRELAAASGARFSRVGGVMVAIQRAPGEGWQILDMHRGEQHAGRWLLIPPDVRDARLQPKRAPSASK